MAKYSSYILFLLISIFVAILYINDIGPLHGMQTSINDTLQKMTASQKEIQDVVLVNIDGVSQDRYGTWPWNHDRIADLTAAIASSEPNVIVLDFEIEEDATQESSGHTQVLADQLSWIEQVVLPYDIALATFRSSKTSNPDHLFDYSLTIDNKLGVMNEQSSLLARKIFLPADMILQSDPYIGFNYIMPDEDRVLRHQPMMMNFEGYYYPSLALMAATVALNVPPNMVKVVEGEKILLGNNRVIPINDRGEFFVNFYKDDPYTRYSAAEILDPGFDFSLLNDKSVIVSVEDFSYSDYFETPVNKEISRQMITATVLSNIENDDMVSIGFDSVALNLLVLFLLGAICAFIMPQISMLYRFVSLGICLFILLNINYFMLSSFNVIVELVYIGLEIILFMGAGAILESSLMLGDQAEVIRKEKEKEKRKKNIQKLTARESKAAEANIREIKSTGKEADEIPTAAVDKRPELSSSTATKTSFEVEVEEKLKAGLGKMGDHQAINLDDDGSATPSPKRAPMIARVEKFENAEDSSEVDTDDSKSDSQSDGIPSAIRDNDNSDEVATRIEEEAIDFDDSADILNASPIPTDVKNLGRYQVEGILGKGAMGQVYKGIDPAINRPVALKTIRLDFLSDPNEAAELKERLHREAQAAGKLSHPNIVTIYDVGSEGDLQYIAMEYLEGRTLESMIKKKVKFNYRIISQIIVQICSALDYAHQQGIVHRDIKPANIMITKDYRVKVMDYGIARVDSNSMTKTGIAMGTPNYISPEQLKGKQVDSRADLFSLGVVMYELLVGKRPFKGENITSLIYSIINNEPEKPSNIDPQIPLLFDHVVGRALMKEPDERYQRATEISSDLSDFVQSFKVRKL
jgi:CHASE2 domain-containing sensor protein/predicted Ser/Thr protein kinase